MDSLVPAVVAVFVLAGIAPAVTAAPVDQPVAADGRVSPSVTVDEAAPDGANLGAPRPPGNNSTRHENPDEVDEDGDLGDVTGWLSGQLGSQLAQNQLQISSGLYESAQGLFGKEFGEQYSKFVDVAGETDTGSDDQTGDQIQQARENQTELAREVKTYRDRREAYREARRNGNDEKARRLARELLQLGSEIDETATKLNRTYTDLSNRTSANLQRAIRDLSSLESNISEQVSEIREDFFVVTRLTVSVDSSTGSFLDPIRITGRLRTANGTTISDKAVNIRIGGQTRRVRTGSNGRFALDYRPTTIATGSRTLMVQYLPNETGRYLGSNATVTVNVSQVTATTTIDEVPATVQFNDTAVVSGTVAAEGIGAEGVPVVVSVGDRQLAETRTTGGGEFTARVRIPAGLRTGDREVRVSVPLEGTAVTAPPETTTVAVASTPTRVTVTGTSEGVDEIRVRGRFQTESGTPVADQRIRLLIAGTPVGTARTDADGQYRTTVSVPQRLASSGGTVELTAVYEDPGTNLAPTENATAVVLPSTEGGGNGAGDSNSGESSGTLTLTLPLVAGVVGLLVVALGGAVFLRRRGGSDVLEESSDPDLDESSAEPATADTLTTARDRATDGDYDTAVRMAYVAAREAIASEYGVDDAGTHWEFLRDCEAAGVTGAEFDAFESLTETYELAAFAPDEIAASTAEDAIDTADELRS